MSFNNGNERRKLNAKWEHLRVQYRKAGMSEDAIQAMDTCTVCQTRRGHDYVVMNR